MFTVGLLVVLALPPAFGVFVLKHMFAAVIVQELGVGIGPIAAIVADLGMSYNFTKE